MRCLKAGSFLVQAVVLLVAGFLAPAPSSAEEVVVKDFKARRWPDEIRQLQARVRGLVPRLTSSHRTLAQEAATVAEKLSGVLHWLERGCGDEDGSEGPRSEPVAEAGEQDGGGSGSVFDVDGEQKQTCRESAPASDEEDEWLLEGLTKCRKNSPSSADGQERKPLSCAASFARIVRGGDRETPGTAPSNSASEVGRIRDVDQSSGGSNSSGPNGRAAVVYGNRLVNELEWRVVKQGFVTEADRVIGHHDHLLEPVEIIVGQDASAPASTAGVGFPLTYNALPSWRWEAERNKLVHDWGTKAAEAAEQGSKTMKPKPARDRAEEEVEQEHQPLGREIVADIVLSEEEAAAPSFHCKTQRWLRKVPRGGDAFSSNREQLEVALSENRVATAPTSARAMGRFGPLLGHKEEHVAADILIVYVHPVSTRNSLSTLQLEQIVKQGERYGFPVNILLVVKSPHYVHWLNHFFGSSILETLWEPDLNLDFGDLDLWMTMPRLVDWVCDVAAKGRCFRWYLPPHFLQLEDNTALSSEEQWKRKLAVQGDFVPTINGELIPGCYVKLARGCGESHRATTVAHARSAAVEQSQVVWSQLPAVGEGVETSAEARSAPGADRDPFAGLEPADPRGLSDTTGWMRDAIGEGYHNAYVDGFSCTSQRRMMFDAWCGVDEGSVPPGVEGEEAKEHRTQVAWVSSDSNAALHDSQLLPPVVVDPVRGLRAEQNSKMLVEEGAENLLWDLESGKFVFKREVEAAIAKMREQAREREGDEREAKVNVAGHHHHLQEEVGEGAEKQNHLRPGEKKFVVFGCHAGAFACGGHGDRWNGIFVTFLLALVLGREFLIDMPDPIGLDNFLVPGRDPFSGKRNVDWVVTEEIRRQLRLSEKRGYLLWDYKEFKQSYFRDFLRSDEETILIYTNKKSFFGPIYRFLFYEQRRTVATDFIRFPYLAHYVFEFLFQPSLHMVKRLLHLRAPAAPFDSDELNSQAVALAAEQHYLGNRENRKPVLLNESKTATDLHTTTVQNNALDVFNEYYIGIHFRSGDIAAGFGRVSEDVDVRHGVDMLVRMLSCAAEVERVLELERRAREDYAGENLSRGPLPLIKWYLATDNADVFESVPQVRSWIRQGKIVHNNNFRSRTHLSQLVTKAPAEGGSVAMNGTLDKVEQLRGVSDGWLDFLVLSKAVAVIASSSAFGLVASQVGAVPYTFSADSCIRIDLQ
eukprot:g446.t1